MDELKAYDLRPFFTGEWERMSAQHWGVLAGCLTYFITVIVVLTLMFFGGTFQRLRDQSKQQNSPTQPAFERLLLYDELLKARNLLPLKPDWSTIKGKHVELRQFDAGKHLGSLYQISNGTPCYNTFGAYDCEEQIWRFLDDGPFNTEEDFSRSFLLADISDGKRYVIVDNSTGYICGMVSLLANSPENLRVRIGDMWLTPAFHKTHVHTDALLCLLDKLFTAGYRRVEWYTDVRNGRARRAIERIGFVLEGHLRKYRVVRDSNQDTCIYSMTNSDFRDEGKERLTRLLKEPTGVSAPSAKDLEKRGTNKAVKAD